MIRSRMWSRCAASAVLSMAAASGAHAAAKAAAQALPAGWHALPLPTLSGAFRQAGSSDTAVLAQNGRDGSYGLAIVPAGGAPARIVKTFHDIKTNPPVLSLAKPGTYKPACHAGGPCEPVAVAHEAVNLCFAEAGCDLVYYDGSAFRDMPLTD